MDSYASDFLGECFQRKLWREKGRVMIKLSKDAYFHMKSTITWSHR